MLLLLLLGNNIFIMPPMVAVERASKIDSDSPHWLLVSDLIMRAPAAFLPPLPPLLPDWQLETQTVELN